MGVNWKKPTAGATVTQQLVENKQVVAQHEASETVEVPKDVASGAPSAEPFCEVGFDASYTHPLAPYKSAKVGVSLKIPCLHTEIDEVFEFAKSWVDQRMGALQEELTSAGEG